MTSWWRKIAENIGATDEPGHSWKAKIASFLGATGEVGRSWAQKIANFSGLQQATGSWARRATPLDAPPGQSWPEKLSQSDELANAGAETLSVVPEDSPIGYVVAIIEDSEGGEITNAALDPAGDGAFEADGDRILVAGVLNYNAHQSYAYNLSYDVGGVPVAPRPIIIPIGDATPVNTVAPVISGLTIVGQTLSASTGTWTHSPTGYTYQWYADSVEIVGETGNTYVIAPEDEGAVITVGVVASNDFGTSSEKLSGATGVIEAVAQVQIILPAGVFLNATGSGQQFILPTGQFLNDG